MSTSLEPKTAAVRTKDWMATVFPNLLVAIVVGLGGSYLTVRVNVAVLEEQNRAMTQQLRELRSEMKGYSIRSVSRDEQKEFESSVDTRLKDYTARFMDFRTMISDCNTRLVRVESEIRRGAHDG